MLDSVTDTFSCISPQPVVHKDDPALQGKVRPEAQLCCFVVVDGPRSAFTAAPHPAHPTPPRPTPARAQSLIAQVFVLKRAVVGVSNEVRAFHNWEEEFKKHYREPPKREMVLWRQRLADCFGFNFTQVRV